MEITVLFENDSIIAVSKPNNMLVHPSYYARNIKEKTLLEHLQEQLAAKLFPVHRLDYKTSGVIIFAKNSKSAAILQKQFEQNTLEKVYLALVRGFLPKTGIIDSPVKNPDTGVYKEAYTSYKRLAEIEVPIAVQPYPQSRYSLVGFTPKTGRMHQLRKHANKISHPIIGDHKYGNRHHNKMFEEQLKLPNLFLHAASLTFKNPETDKTLVLKAELPPFWQEAFIHLNLSVTAILKPILSSSNQNHLD